MQRAPAHTAARSLGICRSRKTLQKPYQNLVLQVLHRQSGDHLDDDELPLDPCPSAGSPDPILHALQKVGIGLSTLSHLRRRPARTRRWPYLQLVAASDVCSRPLRLPLNESRPQGVQAHPRTASAYVKFSSLRPITGGSCDLFLQEAGIMASVRHPNVISYLGVCAEPACIVTEYCSKGSLTDVLRRGRASPAHAAALDWPRRLNMAMDAAKVRPPQVKQ